MVSSAPIYSLVNESRVRAESAAWAKFSSPQNSGEFWASWLAILCSQIEHVSGALLVLGPDHEGGFAAAAVWPDVTRNMQYLGPAAERALKERCGVIVPADGSMSVATRGQAAYIGYPIEVSGVLHGAVVIDIASSPEQELQPALRLLHWASAWLMDQFRQQALTVQETRLARLSLASDLAATAVQQRSFGQSALAVVNELATRLHCHRVSIGFEKSGTIEVQSISHTAKFDRKTDLVRLITDAMDEALDLDIAIAYPPRDDDELGVVAHAELAAEVKDTAICSAPLVDGGHVIGVLTLERTGGEAFSVDEIELCKTVGLLLGPIFRLKLDNERSAWQRLHEVYSDGTRILFGPRHPGAKLIALLAGGLILFCSLVTSQYRVSSKTVIEGAVQRAAVAPFDGYIAESLVRAGDTVKKGQLLCRLDDGDLKLERVRWASEREQSERKYRQAIAAHDRAAMAVTEAQIRQSQAQLTLADEKLARTKLLAPFDGVVVTGDLSQLLGTPVEQGKVLFEIAPLDAYRVILNVDERDISEIKVGQQGDLALSGIPYELMHFAVKQVTPVSTSKEGSNYFRVEAQIEGPSERLQPGMEGIGKISVGERRLIWIWTHRLVDWLRLWTWKWMP